MGTTLPSSRPGVVTATSRSALTFQHDDRHATPDVASRRPDHQYCLPELDAGVDECDAGHLGFTVLKRSSIGRFTVCDAFNRVHPRLVCMSPLTRKEVRMSAL